MNVRDVMHKGVGLTNPDTRVGEFVKLLKELAEATTGTSLRHAGDATVNNIVPFPRRRTCRPEEEMLLDKLQEGLSFGMHDGHAEARNTHGVVVMKGERCLGVWVRLENAFHYLPISDGSAETTDDVEVAYQHSLSVVREAE